jgi:predicted RND superfamily exporter protein
MACAPLIAGFENAIFNRRPVVIGLFFAVTIVMLYFAAQLKIDAGFTKLLPLDHEYMKTFAHYRQEFGGANRILVALMSKEGDIFSAPFFEALRLATDEIFFIPGVDRTQVRSLFTPNTRFTEVVEDGISGGNVVPNDFQATPEGLAKVRENILKADIVGRLVANDFSGAIISAQLLEINPKTGERLDYVEVANQLETKLRAQIQSPTIDVHIIGFAKIIGDITLGAKRVILFFGVTFLVTALLVYLYAQSLKITVISLVCSLIAVSWQLGLLPLLGFGIDPLSILVPFLVFAIGVSHGVQMISAVGAEIFSGADCLTASRKSFRRLLIPGGIALLSDGFGFITILLIKIEIIQEMAITASLGVGAIILTNLLLLPVLLSYVVVHKNYREKLRRRSQIMAPLWEVVHKVSQPRQATLVGAMAIGFLGVGLWWGTDVKIGDLHRGVPEFHQNSRYNMDSKVINDKFSIGVDVISVIAETIPQGCIDYGVMSTLDHFTWFMENVEGVQSVISLSSVAKVINAGWNEGYLKWRVLPRNQDRLIQSVSSVPTSSTLLNNDCSVMPVLIFTRDHKAETIEKVVSKVKEFRDKFITNHVQLKLATGNVGVMAATNEEVKATQFPILIYVYSAIVLLCLLSFRSLMGTLCIVLPLGLVSLLTYGLMNILEIGLKVDTLPVVALGVGIGIDYGIYIYSRLSSILAEGKSLPEAYLRTLAITGNSVIFTGITLAIGVATWIFSPLKFQADMGILLTFMFVVNMLGAIFLLPVLASWLIKPRFNGDRTKGQIWL